MVRGKALVELLEARDVAWIERRGDVDEHAVPGAARAQRHDDRVAGDGEPRGPVGELQVVLIPAAAILGPHHGVAAHGGVLALENARSADPEGSGIIELARAHGSGRNAGQSGSGCS